jgi:hypothetical protein
MARQRTSEIVTQALSLVEICGRELDRLHVAKYRGVNAANRQFIEAALKPDDKVAVGQPRSESFPVHMPDFQGCLDIAEEHRSFAEHVADPLLKSLLLEIAEGYDNAAIISMAS